MTQDHFINWLNGFLAGKSVLTAGEIAQIRATMLSIRESNSGRTNESFPGHGKQILHD